MTSEDEAREALLGAVVEAAKTAKDYTGSTGAQMIAAAAYAYAIAVNGEAPDVPFTIG